MPFWHGDRPGRPRAFGVRIGELTRKLAHLKPAAARTLLVERHALDENAAQNLVEYVREEMDAVSDVPSDRTIIVERFTDELGDWRVCVMTPFGSRVHAPWATVVTAALRARYPGEVETVWSDDGMVFRVPEADEPPAWESFFPASADVERIGATVDFPCVLKPALSHHARLLTGRSTPVLLSDADQLREQADRYLKKGLTCLWSSTFQGRRPLSRAQ